MIVSKRLKSLLEILKRDLRKKEKLVNQYNLEITNYHNQMVEIKDYLGTVHNNDDITVSDRAKIFLEKIKSLETLGEKHDQTIKNINSLKDHINRDIEIFVTNAHQSESGTVEVIKAYVIEYFQNS